MPDAGAEAAGAEAVRAGAVRAEAAGAGSPGAGAGRAQPAADTVLLRSTRVVTPQGERPASVAVSGGRITAVLPHDTAVPPTARLVELRDHALLPGLVDTHVHVNDPGRAHWEGFETATRAAAAGGVTTVIDMPLNSVPPTTTVGHLGVKRDAARGRTHVDTGFWGGAVPGNVSDLRPLHHAGVFGFKCFLPHSGVEEFPPLSPSELADAIAEIARFDGLLIVHAEDPGLIDGAPPGGRGYAGFLASRPRAAENAAVAGLIDLARRFSCRVHILHLSSAEALPLIAAAKDDGVRLTAETCPHYLTLSAEEVPDGATEFKCCPPIRESANRDALWRGLADGVIDCVVSDHSPATAELKHFGTGDFATAWGGISSLQLGLAAVWTEARRRGHGLPDVVRWMAEGPARLAGLSHAKGAIAPGRDADLTVLATEESFTVDPSALLHRNPVTAYAGRTLTGVVVGTWLRGRPIAERGAAVGPPRGRLLTAGEGRYRTGLVELAPGHPAAPPEAPDPAEPAGHTPEGLPISAGTGDDMAAGRAPARHLTPGFTGPAKPYAGGDPYADHRSAEVPFTSLPDLADRRLGASVIAASDEFFAEKENLLRPGPARFDPQEFGRKGKVMDGWETRRRRGAAPGAPLPSGDDHDWALVRLGAPGVVRGIVVDTAHFRGNHPRQVSVEATAAPSGASPEELLAPRVEWTRLVPRTTVGGHAANAFAVDVARRFTHLRLAQYPDGGIARLRVHGEVVPDPRWLSALGTFDLVALEHGGSAEDASDRFYSPPGNTVLPGRSTRMDEGWETRRRRGEGHDWIAYRLAGQGLIRAVEIDTGCYKGNAPGWAAVYGRDAGAAAAGGRSVPGGGNSRGGDSAAGGAERAGADGRDGSWFEILPPSRLQPDTVHRFVVQAPPATHVRLDILPDGGIARLRLHGSLTAAGARLLARRWVDLGGAG